MKKLISFVLVFATIFSLLAGVSGNVNATEYVNYTSIDTNGTWYDGYIGNTSNYYKFSIPNTGNVKIKLMLYTSVWVSWTNEDFSQEYLQYYHLQEGNSQSPHTNTYSRDLDSGAYYFKISSHNNLYGKYKISVTYSSFNTNEKEPNDFDNATTLLYNKAVVASFTWQDNSDWYKIVVPIQSTLVITLKHYMPLFGNTLYNHDLSKDVWYRLSAFDSGSEQSPTTDNIEVRLKPGTYYYHVYQWRDTGKYIISWALKDIDITKPTGLKCTSRSTNAQKISWKKVSGVNGYQIQISNNGGTKWDKAYYTVSNTYTFKKLTAGGKYKFRVRAYKTIDDTKYYSAWSTALSSCATPATVKIKSVSSPKHTRIKAAWAKGSGTVSGYQIVYARNKALTKIAARKNISGKSNVSYTGKNFTKGRTYYVAVRAYSSFGGKKYYGKYSAIKAVKCK